MIIDLVMNSTSPQMPEPHIGPEDTPAVPVTSESTKDANDQDKDRSLWSHDSKPPAYSPPAPPPSGFRVALSPNSPFPFAQAGRPPCHDLDRHQPVFLGSALLDRSVHPCKIAPHLPNPCRVPFGGTECEHVGRYDLLPFDPATMEFVRTAHGRVPPGRRPVEGGYEESGPKLYHAIGVVQGLRVPGKTAEHLVRYFTLQLDDPDVRYQGGCNVAFGGNESFTNEYEILLVYSLMLLFTRADIPNRCWK
jgi:hypothetical protein